MSKNEALASKIQSLRLASGLLQRDVSELTGIPRGRLSEYENGRRLPSGRNLKKLLDLFEVQADEREKIEHEWKFSLCLNPKARHDLETYHEAVKEVEQTILNSVNSSQQQKTVIIIDDIV